MIKYQFPRTVAFILTSLTVVLWPLFVSAQPSSSGDAVDVYQQLTGKTVLRSSNLSKDASTLAGSPADMTNAVSIIESNFAAKGYAVVQDGPHFVRIYPKRDDEFDRLPLHGAELAGVNGAKTEKDHIIPAGHIDFQGVDVNQVLAIYEHLTHRVVLRPRSLSMVVLILKSASPLSEEEVEYAIETTMALNGIAIVSDGDLFAQVVPISERQKVAAHAPKREAGAALLNPDQLAAVGSAAPSEAPKRKLTLPGAQESPITDAQRDLEKLRTYFYEFTHYPDPRVPSAARLLRFYAQLADKSASTSTNFASTMVNLRVTEPLTKSELLYAIETTFSLNGLAVVTNGDGTVSLRRKK